MIEILIIISVISVVGAILKIMQGKKRQDERKKMIERFEKEYPSKDSAK